MAQLIPDADSPLHDRVQQYRQLLDGLPMDAYTHGCILHPELTIDSMIPKYATAEIRSKWSQLTVLCRHDCFQLISNNGVASFTCFIYSQVGGQAPSKGLKIKLGGCEIIKAHLFYLNIQKKDKNTSISNGVTITAHIGPYVLDTLQYIHRRAAQSQTFLTIAMVEKVVVMYFLSMLLELLATLPPASSRMQSVHRRLCLYQYAYLMLNTNEPLMGEKGRRNVASL